MTEWWNAQPALQQIFYLIAIPSTIVMLLQTVLLLFGMGDGHGDGGFGHDLGHGGAETGDHGDFAPGHEMPHDQGAGHIEGLRILTVRGIVAFLAIFGWTGAASLDMGVPAPLAFLLAFLFGTAALLLVAFIIRTFMKLQQSGNLDLQNAVGLIGDVYVPIPAGGHGKVTLVLQERFIDLEAVCPERAVKTGEQVKITAVTQSNILIVSPLFQTNSESN